MAGLRWPSDLSSDGRGSDSARHLDTDAAQYSDDDRSINADSWSVRSDYGSTLDGGDDARQADAADVMAATNVRPIEYSSDKEAPDVEGQPSRLGLQTHWDSAYAEDLVNFHEHGDAGEIWFGDNVTNTMAAWTARICLAASAGLHKESGSDAPLAERRLSEEASGSQILADWNVLDVGSGNGLLLHALSAEGFTDLTGTDYSLGAIELARALSERKELQHLNFLVDDILNSKLNKTFKVITDKGTLDAIGLHPEGAAYKVKYWRAVTRLLEPGGILVITSCNNTRNELVEEVNGLSESLLNGEMSSVSHDEPPSSSPETSSCSGHPTLYYLDHVRTYQTFRFGGAEGSRVCTVAFKRSS